MGTEITVYTVQELIEQKIIAKPLDGNHGEIHPKSSDFVESGIPFVMASDLKNGAVDIKGCKFISETQARKLRKGFALEGDVLLSHKATIGRTAIIGKLDSEFVVLTPQVTYYRVINKNRLNAKYLKYYFDSVEFQQLFEQWAGGGSTRLYLGITGQLKLPVFLPPIKIQNLIVNIVDSYDSKITLNRQLNQTLEQMAQALFKSWFVDFDPVIDNALAAGNEIPSDLQDRAERRQLQLANADHKPLPENIRKLFPSEFELTESLGWVPKGWEEGSLLQSVDLVGGGTPKTTVEEFWNGDIPWFSVVDAPNDSDIFVINTEKYVTQEGVDKSSTKVLRAGTTIISARGTVGKCALVARPMAMNQSCYGVQGKEDFPDEYVYFLIRCNVSDLQNRGHGSVFNTITKDTFESIIAPRPSPEVLKVYSELVKPKFEKVLSNGYQTIELSQLRDTLLPKLISGELRIPEAQTQLEAVVGRVTL